MTKFLLKTYAEKQSSSQRLTSYFHKFDLIRVYIRVGYMLRKELNSETRAKIFIELS